MNTRCQDTIVDLGRIPGVNLNIARIYTYNPLLIDMDKIYVFIKFLRNHIHRINVWLIGIAAIAVVKTSNKLN